MIGEETRRFEIRLSRHIRDGRVSARAGQVRAYGPGHYRDAAASSAS